MSVGMIGVSTQVARMAYTAEEDGKQETDGAARIVRELRDQLERRQQRWARRAGWIRRFIPTGLEPLDAVLPHGGLPCGAITEILANGPGCGAMSLAMRIARRSTSQTESNGIQTRPAVGTTSAGHGQSIVLVDTHRDFYPPAAWQHGIPLDRLIVLRVRHTRDALWAMDQALRCPAIATVIAPFEDLSERDSRRLQLAAESSGCLGFILRVVPAAGVASGRTRSFAHHRSFALRRSFAAVEMLIESVRAAECSYVNAGPAVGTTSAVGTTPAVGEVPAVSEVPAVGTTDSRLCRITLLKVREGMPIQPLLVDLHHETGTLPLLPVPADRSAAKTG